MERTVDKKRALVISLNFNPGHVSHMIASYRQLEEIGYEPWLYVDANFMRFIPEGYRIIVRAQQKPDNCAVAIFLFPSLHNLKEIVLLRLLRCKVVYVFHEPLDKYSTYRNAGFSRMKMLKLRIINLVSAFTVKWSDIILLPSEKAIGYYKANRWYRNENYHYLPLMFDDELTEDLRMKKRQFFSYIGTVASDHSFNEYVNFVMEVIKCGDLQKMKFLIATRSKVERNSQIDFLLDSGRLELCEGSPLSNIQINEYYASSYAVWNAYERTTQSGVLAKAFMFGTPAIVLEKNVSEFVESGKEVLSVGDHTNYLEIKQALEVILDSFPVFSEACRMRFLNSFYYRNYNSLMNSLLAN